MLVGFQPGTGASRQILFPYCHCTAMSLHCCIIQLLMLPMISLLSQSQTTTNLSWFIIAYDFHNYVGISSNGRSQEHPKSKSFSPDFVCFGDIPNLRRLHVDPSQSFRTPSHPHKKNNGPFPEVAAETERNLPSIPC